MKIINYTEAKTNLRKTLDECELTSEPVCIVSRNNQMVIISKAQYDKDKRELYALKAMAFNKQFNGVK